MHTLNILTNEGFYLAYLEASLDRVREKEVKEWDALNIEGWDALQLVQHY